MRDENTARANVITRRRGENEQEDKYAEIRMNYIC